MKQDKKRTETGVVIMDEVYNQENHFLFEEDFMENNMRCIPMIVRFKLDACGVKLKLAEWSRFTTDEREQLAIMTCHSPETIAVYRQFLRQLIFERTGNSATEIPVELNPGWNLLNRIDPQVEANAREIGTNLSVYQWMQLTNLQRFALLKLSRAGHENKNFPKAMIEFGLA